MPTEGTSGSRAETHQTVGKRACTYIPSPNTAYEVSLFISESQTDGLPKNTCRTFRLYFEATSSYGGTSQLLGYRG